MRYSTYCIKVFLQTLPLIKSAHCSHTPSKHSQTVIFSLFAPEIKNSQPYHQRPSLSKPNSCIFITFSICAESRGVWRGNVDLHPPFPPLHWPSLCSLCVPSSNQQTGCLCFASLPRAKVTFSLLCDIRAFYLGGKWLFLWQPSLWSQAVVWGVRLLKTEVFNFKQRQVNHFSHGRVSHDSPLLTCLL